MYIMCSMFLVYILGMIDYVSCSIHYKEKTDYI